MTLNTRDQIILRTLSILIISIGLIVVAMYSFERSRLADLETQKLSKDFKSVANLVSQFYITGDLSGVRNFLDAWSSANHYYGHYEDGLGTRLWSRNGCDDHCVSSIVEMQAGTVHLRSAYSDALAQFNQRYFRLGWQLVLGLLVLVPVLFFVLNGALNPLMDIRSAFLNEAKNRQFSLSKETNDELADLKMWFSEISTAWFRSRDAEARAASLKAYKTVATQVAHDIRSPISAIQIVSQTISGVSGEKKELLMSAVKRLDGIVDDLVITGENISASLADNFSVREVSRRIIREKLQEVGRSDISLTLIEDPEELDLKVKGREVDFERVISNILNNSIEAIFEKGNIQVHMTNSDSRVVVTIEDDGCGISSDDLPNVGRMGFTKGKSLGKGLGLHHAKTTLEALGGALEVSSVRSHGTKVKLTLPALGV